MSLRERLETIQSDTSQAPVAMQTTSFASNKAYQELKSQTTANCWSGSILPSWKACRRIACAMS